MERVKKAGGDLTNGSWGEQIGGDNEPQPEADVEPLVKMTNDDIKIIVNIDDFRKHSEAESPWFVIDGEVYDGTPFLKEHPGGGQSIISAAGMDTSEEFLAIHSEVARAMMPKYHLGTLDEAGKAALSSQPEESQSSEPSPRFLDARSWKKATLKSKQTVSWDTRIFSFQLEHEGQSLGLPVGQHLFIRLRDPVTREAIIRSYTPLSPPSKLGIVDVLVKVYFDSGERKGGKMSQAIDSIPIGHFAEFKGPIGKFEYLGAGRCAINGNARSVERFVMICAGSGITPIFQVLRGVMQDASDTTQCVVINGNRKLDDILCKEELNGFGRDASGRCQLIHTLTAPPDDWQGRRGRVDASLIREVGAAASQPTEKTMALICGPEGFEKGAHSALLEIGYTDDQLLFF